MIDKQLWNKAKDVKVIVIVKVRNRKCQQFTTCYIYIAEVLFPEITVQDGHILIGESYNEKMALIFTETSYARSAKMQFNIIGRRAEPNSTKYIIKN